jgi:signal transduction histidine kinase
VTGATLRRGASGVAALTGVMLAAAGAVAVLAPAQTLTIPEAIANPTSYARVGVGVAAVLLLAAAALVAAGAAAWFGRPDGVLAILGTWAAAAWLAPELAGSPDVTREARSLGLLLAPFVAPLALHLPLRTLGADTASRAVRVGLFAFYVVIGIAAVGHAATWDPFKVIDCAPVCRPGDNILVVHVDIAASSRFVAAGLLATLVASLTLAGWAAARLVLGARSGRGPERAVLLSAAVFGSCLAWWAAADLVIGIGLRRDPGLQAPAICTGLALTLMGCAMTWLLVEEMRRREVIRRLADLTAGGSGPETMEQVLIRSLGDASVRVAYPLLDGGYADAHGIRRDAPSSATGRALATVERGGQVVAIVEYDARPSPGSAADPLSREIGATARLAVDNERLEATLRAQLHDLQESRARIVAVGDGARGRLERNLHDGAQQRLLAVSYELRLARTSVAGSGTESSAASLDTAIGRLDQALLELRDLAHGIYPAVLSEAGLEAALLSLAEEAPLALELGPIPEERFAPAVEAAAYFTVVEAVRHASAAAVERLDVVVARVEGWLRLSVTIAGLGSPSRWMRIDDRVGAAGGRTVISTTSAGATLVEVELPCA